MKKLILLSLTIFCLANGILAQCKTCSQGKHDPFDSTMYPTKVTPNGNSSLGQSYIVQNVCGLNYVTATTATATRYSPPYSGFPATLVVAGLPTACVTIQKAFLYYGASYTEATPPTTTATVTNPIPSTATYAATNVGQAGSVCWGEVGTVTYRADVTAAISGNGTYKVNLNGFANAAWEVDGLSLIIIYTTPATYSGSISIWDGCISFVGGTKTETLNGFTACGATSTASGFMLGGDMQSNVNGNANSNKINGSPTFTFTNNFWNTNVLNPIPNLTSGQNSCVFSPYIGNSGDCWFWSVAGLYWQNTNCVVCTAGTMTVTPTQVNPTCGNNNGSITIGVAGGTGPYTYTWTPAVSTSSNASNLSAGTYSITVKDAGCNTTTVVVTLTTTTLTVTGNVTANVKCNGAATGSASETVAGGTAPYTYTWTPSGNTNSNATGLTAGTYTITVKDKNGCTGTATVTITQPPALTDPTSVVNIKCNGGTGTATVTAGGGTPAYKYLWTPGGNTNSSATGLTAGTYTVTVTDANGCTITASATITQPTALTAATTTTTASCGSSNGSATVTAGGGTPAYKYLWTPGGNTNSNATGLSAGTYTVTITDANGCTLTATATVTNATGETVTITGTTNVLCNGGANGSINTNTTGGTLPYNYAWSNGQTNANATGLSAGTYTITVTDANGCVATASATITQPTAVTVTTGAPVNVLCNGGANGSVTATGGGGTPAYNYSWSNGQTGSSATGLSAGTYTVTVTDANGCTATASATITQPTAVTVTTGAPVNVLCNGGANGSVTATGSGGTPAYNYSWSNGQTGSNATGLSAGTYTVTATDANGCTATTTATITQPTALTLTTTTIQSTCGKSNGSASATAGGGTPAYNYTWSTGQTGSNATGLSAGTYTVTTTDANGCTLTTTAVVSNAVAETVTITTVTNVLCNGGNTGGCGPTVTGGTPAYTYSWSNGQTNSNATGLSAGTYTLTVTDANGCVATATATVTQPTLLTVTTSAPTNVLCNGGNNGSDVATAGGGTIPYAYSWNTIPVQTSSNATGLTAGTYTITVTDANGCTATASTTITQPPALTLSAAGFPVSCNGGNNGQTTAIPGGGTPPYNYSWSNGVTTANANNLAAGNYTITITDANGCSIDTTVTVTQPAAIVVAFSADTINGCAPLCTGLLDATTDPGGTITKWNWSYSDGGSDTVQNPRHCFTTPGSYNVTLTVTDNHGCTGTLTINNMITVYSAPVAAFTFGPQPAYINSPTINFTDNSTDAYGIAGWLWNFNDPLNDAPSTQQNPSHAYGDTGTFCATLTVTNIHGCVDSITECLVVSPEYELFIPNAFSPNGDGKNDIFQPKGEYMSSYKMYIFDRWGMLLFYSDDINKGWNGTVNNGSAICQEDTYVYLIEATDNQGQQHKYLGKVTLMK
jgi:gliding motility-associated-like protein